MMRHAVDGKMGRQEKTVPTSIMKTSSSIIRLPITMELGCVLSRAISGFCEGSNGRTKSEESATSTVSTVRNAILRFTSGVSLSSCSWLVFDCQIASSKLFSTAVMFCAQFWYVVTADGRDSKWLALLMRRMRRMRLMRLEVARAAAGHQESHQEPSGDSKWLARPQVSSISISISGGGGGGGAASASAAAAAEAAEAAAAASVGRGGSGGSRGSGGRGSGQQRRRESEAREPLCATSSRQLRRR